MRVRCRARIRMRAAVRLARQPRRSMQNVLCFTVISADDGASYPAPRHRMTIDICDQLLAHNAQCRNVALQFRLARSKRLSYAVLRHAHGITRFARPLGAACRRHPDCSNGRSPTPASTKFLKNSFDRRFSSCTISSKKGGDTMAKKRKAAKKATKKATKKKAAKKK